MLSYTSLRTLYGQFTNNTTSANLTNGDLYINNSLRQIYSSAPWDFLEIPVVDFTVAGTGTGTITSSGLTVTGAGTVFLSQVKAGDSILAGNQIQIVTSVTSDTVLTTRVAFSPVIPALSTFQNRRQFYGLPNDYDKLVAVTIQIGSVQYIPREVADKTTWDFLNQNTNITSNIPAYFFILDNKIGFYPTPSSGGNSINYTYRKKVRDLGVADYVTGTIASIANGASAVVGAATSWTTQMIGRFIRITRTNAVASGDGDWYPIIAVGSGTALTLGRPYAGTTLALATAAYAISEVPALPETYQMMPVYGASVWYWNANGNPQKAKYYKEMYDSMMMQLRADRLSKTTDDSIKDIVGGAMQNPNLYVMN